MSNLDKTNYEVDLSDGVITFKNINITFGFVNPMFRRQGLAKKLLSIVEEKTKIKQHKKRVNYTINKHTIDS